LGGLGAQGRYAFERIIANGGIIAMDTDHRNILSADNLCGGEPASAKQNNTPQPGKKLKILVVDDEVDLRAFLTEFCAVNGYEAKCAGDGLAGLRYIEEGSFDLVIVDYLMPELNGVELVKRAKERNPGLPVIAMSAWYEMERAFREAGAYKFMKKPFDPYLLEEELKAIARNGED
jgi:two-component system response regulator (stage 0 sporulation protein F)